MIRWIAGALLALLIWTPNSLAQDEEIIKGKVFHLKKITRQRRALGRAYYEFFKADAMKGAVYVLGKGGSDGQKPHDVDEVYYVVRGKAVVLVGKETAQVETGSVIYVPAGEEHRFQDIEEDLELLVIFAPGK